MWGNKWKKLIDCSIAHPYEEKNPSELKVGDILVFPKYQNSVLFRETIAYSRVLEIKPFGTRTLEVQTDLWTGVLMIHQCPVFLLSDGEDLVKVLVKDKTFLAYEARVAELTEKAKTSIASHIELNIYEEEYKESDKVVVCSTEADHFRVLRVDYYDRSKNCLLPKSEWFRPDSLEVRNLLKEIGWYHESFHFEQIDPFGEVIWVTIYSPSSCFFS